MQRTYRDKMYGNKRYSINDKFNSFIENVSEYVLSNGELVMDENQLKESFLYQLSHSPDDIKAINLIEYGCVKPWSMSGSEEYTGRTCGLKIKDKDVLLSDIVYVLEDSEIVEFIKSKMPILTTEEIEAAQRVLTGLVLGFECNIQNTED